MDASFSVLVLLVFGTVCIGGVVVVQRILSRQTAGDLRHLARDRAALSAARLDYDERARVLIDRSGERPAVFVSFGQRDLEVRFRDAPLATRAIGLMVREPMSLTPTPLTVGSMPASVAAAIAADGAARDALAVFLTTELLPKQNRRAPRPMTPPDVPVRIAIDGKDVVIAFAPWSTIAAVRTSIDAARPLYAALDAATRGLPVLSETARADARRIGVKFSIV